MSERFAIHPRDRHGASRTAAYLMVAAIPAIIASAVLDDTLRQGGGTAVAVAVVIAMLAVGAVACWRYPDRLPDGLWVLLPVLVVGVMAGLSMVTRDSGVTGQVFFLWPVLYAATFLRRAMVWLVLATTLAAECVLVFSLLPARVAAMDTATLMAALTIAAIIIVALRERRDQILDLLEQEAMADALTGLANRRSFEHALARSVAQARRDGSAVALLTIDVDRFKAINDTWGHSVGDDALRLVGRSLSAVTREADVVARLGGDEFVAVLDSGGTGAARVVEALRARLDADTDLPCGPPTLSIGIAVLPADADTVDGLLAASDAALYDAKAGGRNRAAYAGRPPAAAADAPSLVGRAAGPAAGRAGQ